MSTVDNYAIICKSCGRRRGNHYSMRNTNNSKLLTFCNLGDLKHYMDTGKVKYSKMFVPVKIIEETHKHNSKWIKNTKVIMAITDRWMKKGQIGVIILRDKNTVQVTWNNGKTYRHYIENVALLKGTKDPNLLFLAKRKSTNCF